MNRRRIAKPNSKRENSKTLLWILAIAIIVIGVFLYLISLGQIPGGVNEKIPDEWQEDRDRAKRRHDKLKFLIEKQKDLKNRLDKKFKLVFITARFIIVSLWILIIYILRCHKYVNSLEDILIFSEAGLIILIVLNFLCFGTLKGLSNFYEFLKVRLENWIWGKYLNIDEKIINNESESSILADKLSNDDSE